MKTMKRIGLQCLVILIQSTHLVSPKASTWGYNSLKREELELIQVDFDLVHMKVPVQATRNTREGRLEKQGRRTWPMSAFASLFDD